MQELARGRSVAPGHDLGIVALRRLDVLADESGDYMRRGRVEVVARSVEVHGEDHRGIEAVLLAISLALDEKHLLREPVRRVRLLGISVPDVVLTKRDRGELRVRANRPGCYELLQS